MSKTLFNTNTFQSKTLQNSNTIDIGDSNVTNFTATNATITNLTNDEVQANSLKTGITTAQTNAIAANSLKTGITTAQTNAIAANTTAISTINVNIEGITASSDITTIDNQVNIINDTEPQFSIANSNGGRDATMSISGKRTNSTTSRNAKIDLQNQDNQLSPSVGNMCSIVGRVSNPITNVGGLEIVNYVDGQTATGALTMSHNGNFNIGNGSVFQDNHKLNVVGTLNVVSSIYQIPQMTTYNFDKAIVSNDLWGNGNRQTDLDSTRTSGTAFSSHSSGIITFTQTGTYHIKVSGNLQSIRQNDRLAFAIYLVTIDSSNDPITDYFENSNYNFFGWLYSRNTTDGAHGNVSFQDHLYISSGQKITIRNKLDVNGLDFNDELAEDHLNNYLNITITKISAEDIYTP